MTFDFDLSIGPPEPEWFETTEEAYNPITGRMVPVVGKIPNFGRLATHRSVKSGNWSDPSTWNCGKVPLPSNHISQRATVAIMEGHTVIYDLSVPLEVETWTQNPDGTWRFGI